MAGVTKVSADQRERLDDADALLAARGRDRLRQLDDRPRDVGLRLGEHDRLALVGERAQARVERDPAEQRRLHLGCQRLAAARAEELLARSVLARQVGHVLDDAEQPHVRLPRHLRRAHGHLLGGAVRRRHDDGLGPRQQLSERDRHVARAGRHVHDQRVQLTPVDVGEELLERPVEHGPAPHHRRVLVQEEADRHHLEVAAHGRDDHRRSPPSTATGRWWTPSMCGIE